tara:strand:+ start:867 stop:2924 length:2058 start_codon:yes stop_codon:yes gene_type:complete
MGYKVTYNGFGMSYGNDGSSGTTVTIHDSFQWDHIKVQQYSSKPIFSEDDHTHWTTHHTFSFTALLKVDGSADGKIDDVINNCKKRLSKQGRLLVIQVKDDDGNYNDIARTGVDTSSDLTNLTTGNDVAVNTDEKSYPRVQFNINKFYGNNNAMVSVTVEWRESIADTVDDAETNWFVLSHQWRQRFNIQENGLQTYTVEGTIHVKPYLNTAEECLSGSNDVMHGTNPDSYRRVVMPLIPSGFRVKSMNWAIDPTGQKLIYSITMQEHARELPRPGKVGSGSFRFKKSITGAGSGLLGTKVFDAELEGDAKADERELLAALLQASTARIQWVGEGKDLVQSIEIRESDIFSKKRIGITIIAQGMDTNVTGALQDGEYNDLNFGIHTPLVPEGREAIAPNAYGSALIGAYKKKMFVTHGNYTAETFPKASATAITNSNTTGQDPYSFNTMGTNQCPPEVDEVVYEIPPDTIITPGEPPAHGDLTGDLGDDSESEISQDGKILKVIGSERLAVKHNITVFSTGGTSNAWQIPWQTSAPEIYLESEYTISRHDKPPPMLQYKLPQNSVVLDEQTSVDSGQMDGNGHRIYTRNIKRKVQLLYGWSDDKLEEKTTSMSWLLNTEDGISFTLNYSYPEVDKMFRAHDYRTDDTFDIQNSDIFSGMIPGDRDQFFPVDFSIPISGAESNPNP